MDGAHEYTTHRDSPWCNTPYKHQPFVNTHSCLLDVVRRLPSRHTSSDNRRSNINNAAATAAAAATASTTAATNSTTTSYLKADIHDVRATQRFSNHIGSVIVAAAFRTLASCIHSAASCARKQAPNFEIATSHVRVYVALCFSNSASLRQWHATSMAAPT